MNRVGIFCGSFNPIHNGHFEVAKYFTQNKILDHVWMMPSICSPFKVGSYMPDVYHRFKMVQIACNEYDKYLFDKKDVMMTGRIKPSNLEMYAFCDRECAFTSDVMKRLVYGSINESDSIKYSLILGYDVFNEFDKFKNYEWMLTCGLFDILVVSRPEYSKRPSFITYDGELKNVKFFDDGPMNDISSTEIREKIKSGKIDECWDIMDKIVLNYIKKNKLYGV